MTGGTLDGGHLERLHRTIMNNIEQRQTTVKLIRRVEQIHLVDSDTAEEQKQQLIRILNKYEMCFVNNTR